MRANPPTSGLRDKAVASAREGNAVSRDALASCPPLRRKPTHPQTRHTERTDALTHAPATNSLERARDAPGQCKHPSFADVITDVDTDMNTPCPRLRSRRPQNRVLGVPTPSHYLRARAITLGLCVQPRRRRPRPAKTCRDESSSALRHRAMPSSGHSASEDAGGAGQTLLLRRPRKRQLAHCCA